MRLTTGWFAARVALVLGLLLVLAGCGDDTEGQADAEETNDEETDVATDDEETNDDATDDQDDEQLADLEQELKALREDLEGNGADDAEEDDAEEDDAEEDDAEEEEQDEGDRRVFEVGETKGGETEDDEHGFALTLERIIVADYHVEVELTGENSHPEHAWELWGGDDNRSEEEPALFDQQDQRFSYQHPAGMDARDGIELGPGERLEAVLMFGGPLSPDAEVLSFELDGDAFADGPWQWNVDLEEAEQ